MERYSYDRRQPLGDYELGENVVFNRGVMRAFAQGKLGVYWPDIEPWAAKAIENAGGSTRGNVVRLGRGAMLIAMFPPYTKILLPNNATIWMHEYELGVDWRKGQTEPWDAPRLARVEHRWPNGNFRLPPEVIEFLKIEHVWEAAPLDITYTGQARKMDRLNEDVWEWCQAMAREEKRMRPSERRELGIGGMLFMWASEVDKNRDRAMAYAEDVVEGKIPKLLLKEGEAPNPWAALIEREWQQTRAYLLRAKSTVWKGLLP